ncbi:MAG: hypothetical protein N3B01_00375 [Verrucomicrobiae bacterium]|nr:hypothetical protein [Verrucomicrobiae bacterium]
MGDKAQLYAERLKRYTIAMRNGKPDRIPIRPFVAEFICNHTGYTCQEVTQDYQLAFEATCRCCLDYDWDAVVPNMVYLWAGIPQAVGLRYYQIPGVGLDPNIAFNYVEPPEEHAFMRADEYDEFITDPTAYLFNVWLPRVSTDIVPPGQPNTYRNNVAFFKAGLSVLSYFSAFGPQIERLRTECGTVSAICGMLKAPLDVLADKFRGYLGLCEDLVVRPKKVLAACEAMMPHLLHLAITSADPTKTLPLGFWMHRTCVPFISQEHFNNIHWPTLKPMLDELWRRGHQVLFYAEGKWDAHLETFAQLPEGSIIFHIDRTDPLLAHRILHKKFALSGGVPNYLLAFGTPQQVRDYCKMLIDNIGRDGGYIMDASAIMQNDTKVENMRALTEFTRQYGVY